MKVKMIYLAAGNSRRFGSNKLYYEIQGKPMFQYGLEALEKVLEEMEETTLTVVTEYPRIREYVLGRKQIWKERISVVGSPMREKGISYSIRAGLLGEKTYDSESDPVTGAADYYLFCVADQPWVSAETIRNLIQKTTEGGYVGGYTCWKEMSGNPAVFSRDLLPELLSLTGDTGGKKILKNRGRVCTVQAGDAREIEDIDEKTETV